jgi:hypothetical protein
MHLIRWSRVLASLGLVLAAAGCRDVASPEQLRGTYVMRSVGESPVPFTSVFNGGSMTQVADTIRFLSDGSVEEVQIVHYIETGNIDEVFRWTMTYEVERKGDEITLMQTPPPCMVGLSIDVGGAGPLASSPGSDGGGCSYAVPRGRLANGRLILDGFGTGDRVFEKVGG